MTGRNNLPGWGSPMSFASPYRTTSVTPTITQGANTFSSNVMSYSCSAGVLWISGVFVAGSSVASTNLTITLPAGYSALSVANSYGAIGNTTSSPNSQFSLLVNNTSSLLANSYSTTASNAYGYWAIVLVAR